MADGFISPESPGTVEEELRALTVQGAELPPITRGRYILEEDDLSESQKELLHGRTFVIDKEEITAITANGAVTYYLAADKTQGLVVPARSLSINNYGEGDIYYRFTDSGDLWTDWITLETGVGDNYLPDEKCRFAEVQVYVSSSGTKISIRAAR